MRAEVAITPEVLPKPGEGTSWPYQPVMAVGTAMMAAQLVTFFMTRFMRVPCTLELVSTMVVTRFRNDSYRCSNPASPRKRARRRCRAHY